MKRPYRDILLVSGMCLVLGLSLELAVRVKEALDFGTPILSPMRTHSDLMVRDGGGFHGRPHQHFKQFRLNNIGMRGPDVDSAKPNATCRVLVLGASESFGLYESQGKEYPRQLQDTLNARLLRGACRTLDDHYDSFEVLNAAFAGMSLPTVTQSFELRFRHFDPDVVVYFPTPDQYLYDALPRARPITSNKMADQPPLSWALQPRLPEYFRDRLKAALPSQVAHALRRAWIWRERRSHPSNWLLREVPPERLQAFEHDLRALVGSIRSAGTSPVLVAPADAFNTAESPDSTVITMAERQNPQLTPEAMASLSALAPDRVRAVAADSNVPLADCAAVFSELRGALFVDMGHFTDSGAAIVAQVIADAVQEALECGGPSAQSPPGDR
jgi:hypothetical protein